LKKTEFDFLTWTSFPSSAKLLSDEVEDYVRWPPIPHLWVTPGAKIKITLKAKREGTTPARLPSHMTLIGINERGEMRHLFPPFIRLPETPFDWRLFTREETLPTDIVMIGGQCAGGVGITWFDDLRIFMDNKLIYADDFSNWNPYIGAGALGVASGIGAHQLTKDIPIAVGAGVIGSLVGAAIGYFIPPLV